MAKFSGTGLPMKRTKQKCKQETRDSHRNAKNQIETSWSATSVDRCYGSRQSFGAWQEERLNQSFESKDDAKNRVLKRKKQEQDGLRVVLVGQIWPYAPHFGGSIVWTSYLLFFYKRGIVCD